MFFLDILFIFYMVFELFILFLINVVLISLLVVLFVLDFSIIKGEFFLVIVIIFSKINSLVIKVCGLEVFVIFCGGVGSGDDGLDGFVIE